MKNERNTKQLIKTSNGITLIALVITIIVLLILAGVVIATLTGDNGILTKARTAQTTTNEKDEEEQIKIGYSEYLIADQTGKQADFKVSGATVTGNKGDWKIKFGKTGKEYYFDGDTITKDVWKQDGDTITNIETNQTLKVGDYVDYDPTLEANASDLTYTSKTDRTGANSDQEFNVSTYKNAGYGWRVLGTSNGKIRLISEEFIGAGTYTDSNRTKYTLKGQQGFINGIEELNKISAIFGHGKGAKKATSITVEDINGITGYNPETAKYGEGNFNEYGNKVTYTRGSGTALSSSATNGRKWSGTENTFNYYDKASKTFKALTSGSTKITSTFYYYYPGTLNSLEDNPTQGDDGTGTYNKTFQMLFGKYSKDADGCYRNFTGEGVSPSYWLASDYASPGKWCVNWGLRLVNDGGVNIYHYGGLYFSDGSESSNSYGVRPVVSLKSDVSLEWNEVAKEWKIK
jgi:hypothetical protein